ncbi:MAG: ABC transporter ATP-binding protein [Alphaproteobacteria bacterium]|nr:ABC transporter ATP-binding protein [Alphaproteobacteria bacterium]
MSELKLEGVVKRYGQVVAVERVDLHIHEGEFLTLLGPSGCGKTTTLRMIAGFIDPTEGRILIGAEDVTGLPPQKRDIGMVFQDYALFPHLTIADNIAFSLVERRVPTADRRKRIGELLDLIRLPGVEERYPSELSGGQQQRVALARAIAHPPRVLLMDEPLGALDLKLREAMQEELRALQDKLQITTVYVTHDQGEAMSLSDRIAVMNAGRIEQLDTPSNIYGAPRTEFVANFVGKINFLRGTLSGQQDGFALIDTPVGRIRARMAASASFGSDSRVTVSIRPENLRVIHRAEDAGDMNTVAGRIVSRLFTGNLSHVRVAVPGEVELLVEMRPSDLSDAAEVTIGWRPEHGVLITN